jgi:hypothetical protein
MPMATPGLKVAVRVTSLWSRHAGLIFGGSSMKCTPRTARRSPKKLGWIGVLYVLYDVEAAPNGMTPDERRHERQGRSRSIADTLKAWADEVALRAVPAVGPARDLPLYAVTPDGA